MSDIGGGKPQPKQGRGVYVTVERLCYAVPNRYARRACISDKNKAKLGGTEDMRLLLDNVSLVARPGEILAIVGPSGSGKTTLLNVIAQRASPTGILSGQVLFNGQSINGRGALSKDFNYVMTHDRMLPYLTVDETLKYAAALKLPGWPKEAREARVNELIAKFSLERCRHTCIGGEWRKGLSSGEMKRVAIACELLDDPSVLILDEPTSGLDSALSARVLQLLLAEARRGRTVICTVHQPPSEVFALFDRFLLLAGGRVAYEGPVDRASSYFASCGYNTAKDWAPCDYYLELVSEYPSTHQDDVIGDEEDEAEYFASQHRLTRDERAELLARWEASAEGGMILDDIKAAKQMAGGPTQETSALTVLPAPETDALYNSPSASLPRTSGFVLWWREFATLTKRSFWNTLRNPLAAVVAILVQLMQGLILGGIFYHTSTVSTGKRPDPLLAVSFWENTFIQSLIWGVDGVGTHPLVNMWSYGVDGNGSYILGGGHISDKGEKEAKDAALFLINDISTCLYKEYDLQSKYPEIPELETVKIPTTWDELTPKRIYQNLMMYYQWFDLMWPNDKHKGLDLSFVDECYETYMQDEKPSPATFFLCFLQSGKPIFDPMIKCVNLPPLPSADKGVSPLRKLSTSLERASEENRVEIAWEPNSAPKRKLITFGTDSRTIEAVKNFLGEDLMTILEAASDVIKRVTECEDGLCSKLKSWRDFFADFFRGTMHTIASMLSLSGCLFFVATVLGFASYDALLTFPQERALFNRESANGMYRSSSYYLAKNVADFPFQVVPCTVLVLLFYLLVGFDLTVRQVAIYLGITTLICYSAYGFAYFISALAPKMEIALLVAPLTLVIWLVVAGFFLRDGDIPLWIDWFKYLSFYRWAFFALCCNQFELGKYFGTLPNSVNLALSGVTYTSLWGNILLLFAIGTLWRICGYFALHKMNRNIGIEA